MSGGPYSVTRTARSLPVTATVRLSSRRSAATHCGVSPRSPETAAIRPSGDQDEGGPHSRAGARRAACSIIARSPRLRPNPGAFLPRRRSRSRSAGGRRARAPRRATTHRRAAASGRSASAEVEARAGNHQRIVVTLAPPSRCRALAPDTGGVAGSRDDDLDRHPGPHPLEVQLGELDRDPEDAAARLVLPLQGHGIDVTNARADDGVGEGIEDHRGGRSRPRSAHRRRRRAWLSRSWC